MKSLLFASFVLSAATASAAGVSISEGGIDGNLVGAASRTVNGRTERILVDLDGLSLYTFELDSANVSACSGGCLTEWPPQHVPAGVTVHAPFGQIQGGDGQLQLTLNGLPLYHYVDDQKAGDVFGQYPKWDVITVTK